MKVISLFLLELCSPDSLCSLGRILNIRFPSVRESLRKEILLLRVFHWGEISFFEVLCVRRLSPCRDITSQHDFLRNDDHIPMRYSNRIPLLRDSLTESNLIIRIRSRLYDYNSISTGQNSQNR